MMKGFVFVGSVLLVIAGIVWGMVATGRLPRNNDLETAALQNLAPALNHGPSYLSFELGYGSESELNAQRDRIEAARKGISGIADPGTRRAYQRWVDFYQKENDEARAEMLSGAKREAWLKYKERDRQDRERINALAERLQKP